MQGGRRVTPTLVPPWHSCSWERTPDGFLVMLKGGHGYVCGQIRAESRQGGNSVRTIGGKAKGFLFGWSEVLERAHLRLLRAYSEPQENGALTLEGLAR